MKDKLFPVVVVDGAKQILDISRRPGRIVSLSPGVTELLFALGAGKQVVGVTSWCNYPPEVAGLARVGDMNVDFEAVAGLAPDLIVADASLQQSTAERLTNLGFLVLMVKPAHVVGILDTIELLGRATGNIETAQDVIIELTGILSSVRHNVEACSLALNPVSVLILFETEQLFSAGKGTYIHEAIARAGGRNIAGDSAGEWPLLNEEHILVQDPEVILLTYGDPEKLYARANWQQLRAIRERRVLKIDPDQYSRPTDRLIRGITPLQQYFLTLRGE